jgi:1-acyl-sn-glycerol-3-phosphate acyltransferase
MVRYGQYPLGLGNRITFEIHEPFAIKGKPFEEIIIRTENTVVNGIKI